MASKANRGWYSISTKILRLKSALQHKVVDDFLEVIKEEVIETVRDLMLDEEESADEQRVLCEEGVESSHHVEVSKCVEALKLNHEFKDLGL